MNCLPNVILSVVEESPLFCELSLTRRELFAHGKRCGIIYYVILSEAIAQSKDPPYVILSVVEESPFFCELSLMRRELFAHGKRCGIIYYVILSVVEESPLCHSERSRRISPFFVSCR